MPIHQIVSRSSREALGECLNGLSAIPGPIYEKLPLPRIAQFILLCGNHPLRASGNNIGTCPPRKLSWHYLHPLSPRTKVNNPCGPPRKTDPS